MIDDRHLRFLSLAKREALKNQEQRRQFGAVIVDGNKVVAIGRNRRSHPGIPDYQCQNTERKYFGLHGEVSALLRCDFSVRGMTIYVHGQNRKSGKNVYSKPCELCAMALRKRGIAKAVFSTYDGYEVVIFDKDFHSHPITTELGRPVKI